MLPWKILCAAERDMDEPSPAKAVAPDREHPRPEQIGLPQVQRVEGFWVPRPSMRLNRGLTLVLPCTQSVPSTRRLSKGFWVFSLSLARKTAHSTIFAFSARTQSNMLPFNS